MAKGYEIHQARAEALRALGKDLARRAKSKCELTEVSGVSLRAYEVPPVESVPSLDRTLLISEKCFEVLERPKMLTGQEWRCLATTVWSESPAVQVVAWRMLKKLAEQEEWAESALEEVFLDPEVQSWAESALLSS